MQTIEVGKPFTGPVPQQDGVIFEVGPNGDTILLIQWKRPSDDETAAFAKGLERYSLFIQPEPPYLAIWAFKFPIPVGYIDAPFHAGLYKDDRIEKYLSTGGNLLQVYILDGYIVKHIRIVGLTLKVIQDFHDAIKRQLSTFITRNVYEQVVDEFYNRFSSKDIFQMGRQYKIIK